MQQRIPTWVTIYLLLLSFFMILSALSVYFDIAFLRGMLRTSSRTVFYADVNAVMGVIMGVCTVFRSKPALIATIVSIAAIKLLELRSVATGDDSGAGIAITAVVFTTMFFVPQALSLFQIVTSKDQKDDIPKEVSNVSEVIEEVKNEKLEEQESISQDL